MPRFRRILPFLLMFLLLLPGASRAEEAILFFSSAAEVHADSSLLVREDITVRVEGREIRRGIFRDFPTTYRTPSGKTVRVGFSVEEALLNGKSIPWKTESRSNGVRVYLGDANSNAPRGEQTYTLVYTTTGQLGFFEQHDELYWNVTGNDWAFPIEKARFSMSLPGGASFSTVISTRDSRETGERMHNCSPTDLWSRPGGSHPARDSQWHTPGRRVSSQNPGLRFWRNFFFCTDRGSWYSLRSSSLSTTSSYGSGGEKTRPENPSFHCSQPRRGTLPDFCGTFGAWGWTTPASPLKYSIWR